MMLLYLLLFAVLLLILTLAAYVDRVYSEMGKFLAREYQDNIDSWEQIVEPKLGLARESLALSASVLRQLSVAAIALLTGLRLYTHVSPLLAVTRSPSGSEIALAIFEIILLILIFDRLLPQILFTRTSGLWIVRIRYVLQTVFYLILPVTLLLGLLLSIAALAEPEDTAEEERPEEAMEALLEAGEEEGILEESDRELVRSVVEFGDKVAHEVMTPRPEVFAVPGSMSLERFTAEIAKHVFSRVPVYSKSLDNITGIIFAHDLLQIPDSQAASRTVAQLQRPAAFVPETKKVAELLREMQREKQHMSIVIDEYGGVAGLVTIEDLIEAIVGEIADEHEETRDDVPVREADGAYVVPGSFEISRLRDLFSDPVEPSIQVAEDLESTEAEEPVVRESVHELHLPEHYESTTVGGLVSEMAGHIPLPGEVVEEDGLRLEVLASTDRRIDRIRVRLSPPPTE